MAPTAERDLSIGEGTERASKGKTVKLYVGNLNYDTTEDTLREAFAADGRTVSEVAIITDRDTGRPRGFAFVTMGSAEDGKNAIEALDGTNIDGRPVRVNEAQERKPRRDRW